MFVRDYKVIYVDPGATLGLIRDIQCSGDDIAMEQARRLFPQGVVEVWEGTRLIGRLEKSLEAKEQIA